MAVTCYNDTVKVPLGRMMKMEITFLVEMEMGTSLWKRMEEISLLVESVHSLPHPLTTSHHSSLEAVPIYPLGGFRPVPTLFPGNSFT